MRLKSSSANPRLEDILDIKKALLEACESQQGSRMAPG
jgi:hypothetical protein